MTSGKTPVQNTKKVSDTNIVEMHGITMKFPGVLALDKVDFSVKPGEVMCLLGENGAGKSTLMKVLTGVYIPNEGHMLLDGKPLVLQNTQDAYSQGISIIFQEFNLCANLTVMENIFMGNEERTSFGFVSYRKMKQKAAELFRRLNIDIDPEETVKNLGVASQQMVEIAKALSQDTKILIMDEPTSSLAESEIRTLFSIVRDLQAKGIAVVFISHKLKEVIEISDRITVLRDGKLVRTVHAADINEDQLISMMVGRDMKHFFSERQYDSSNEVVFEVEGLSGPPKIQDVSFSLKKGEIVGLAGLVGAGRTELSMLIMGAVKRWSGTLKMHGKPVSVNSPNDAVRQGIGYVPEDRKNLGLVQPMSTRENLTLSIHKNILNKFGFISFRKECEIADTYIKQLQIKVSSREHIVKTLSGGNQQKVVIGKWLSALPEVMILDEPTRGIDVGSKAEVHRLIAELADAGMSILLISSELPEILAISDRVLVLSNGRLTADLAREEANEENIMQAAVKIQETSAANAAEDTTG